MLNDKLRNKIDKAFKQNFIGNFIDFSDQEISSIYDEVSSILIRITDYGESIHESEYKLVVLALIYLTKEWGEDEDSWLEHISKKLLGSNDDIKGKIYKQIQGSIDSLGKKNIFLLNTAGKKYYATMCMHAFAPKASIFSLFDICWEIYFRDLEEQDIEHNRSFLELIANSLKNKFSIDSNDERDIQIGSKVYSFRAGIKGLALEYSNLLVELLGRSFSLINIVLKNKPIDVNTYFVALFKEWWNKKQETLGEEIKKNKTKQNHEDLALDYSQIRSQFILDNGVAEITISGFYIEDGTNEEPKIEIYVDENLVKTTSIPTFTGSGLLHPKTNTIKYKLDDFEFDNRINIRCKIFHLGRLIYDSKHTLYRSFIIFSKRNKELDSKILIPDDYYIYHTNLNDFSHPQELHRIQGNLFSCSACEGECIGSNDLVVFFNSKERNIIDEIRFVPNIEYGLKFRHNGNKYNVIKDDYCLYTGSGVDVSKIGVRYENETFPLAEFESKSSGDGRIFKITALADAFEPVTITIFRYSDNHIFEVIDIIKFYDLNIIFDKELYYGDKDFSFGSVLITAKGQKLNKEFSIYDKEFCIEFNDGELLFDPPILRWRIDDKEWNTAPIDPIFYKEIGNSSVLQIDNSITLNNYIVKLPNLDSKVLECYKNGQYKIGQTIHASIDTIKCSDTYLFLILNDNYYKLTQIIFKPQFLGMPVYVDNIRYKVEWNPMSYKGDDCDFEINILKDLTYKQVFKTALSAKQIEIINLDSLEEGYYLLKIISISKGIIHKRSELLNEKIHFGNIKNLRFKNKILKISEAKFFSEKNKKTIKPIYIDNIHYLGITAEGLDCYSGKLFVLKGGQKSYLNYMNYADKSIAINPIRLDLRRESTCYLRYGLVESDPEFDFDDEFLINDKGITTIGKSNEGNNVDYFIFKEE